MLNYDIVIIAFARFRVALVNKDALDVEQTRDPYEGFDTFTINAFLNTRASVAQELAQQLPAFVPVAQLVDNTNRSADNLERFLEGLDDEIQMLSAYLRSDAAMSSRDDQIMDARLLLLCAYGFIGNGVRSQYDDVQQDDMYTNLIREFIEDDPREITSINQVILTGLTLWYADYRGYRRRVINACGLKGSYDSDEQLDRYLRTAEVSRDDVIWMRDWVDEQGSLCGALARDDRAWIDSHDGDARRWMLLYRELVRADIRFPRLDEYCNIILQSYPELLYGSGVEHPEWLAHPEALGSDTKGVVDADFYIARDQECARDPYLRSLATGCSRSLQNDENTYELFSRFARAESVARGSMPIAETEWEQVAVYAATVLGIEREAPIRAGTRKPYSSDEDAGVSADSSSTPPSTRAKGRHFKKPEREDTTTAQKRYATAGSHFAGKDHPATSHLPTMDTAAAAPEAGAVAQVESGSVISGPQTAQSMSSTDYGAVAAFSNGDSNNAAEPMVTKVSNDFPVNVSSYDPYRYGLLGVVAFLDLIAMSNLSLLGIIFMVVVTVVGLGAYGVMSSMCGKGIEALLGIAGVPAGVSLLLIFMRGLIPGLFRAVLLAAAGVAAYYFAPSFKQPVTILLQKAGLGIPQHSQPGASSLNQPTAQVTGPMGPASSPTPTAVDGEDFGKRP